MSLISVNKEKHSAVRYLIENNPLLTAVIVGKTLDISLCSVYITLT